MYLTLIQYTFIRDMRIMEIGGKKTWVVLAKFHDFPCKPEKNGVIRVTELKQACVMQSDGKVGARGEYNTVQRVIFMGINVRGFR